MLPPSGPGLPQSRMVVPGPGEDAAGLWSRVAAVSQVVRRLENANLSLDEAMKLFEEGVELSRDCQKQLEQAEGRVEVLLKKADGKLVAEPFEPEAEEES